MPYIKLSASTTEKLLELLNTNASTLKSFRVVTSFTDEFGATQFLAWVNDLDAPKVKRLTA